MGMASEPLCEIPVELNKIGMVLLGGHNLAAVAEEAGIDSVSLAMSTVMDYQGLIKFQEGLM